MIQNTIIAVRSAILFSAALLCVLPDTAAARRKPTATSSPATEAPSDEAALQRAQQAITAGQAALSRGELTRAVERAAESLRQLPAESLFLLGQVALREGRTLAAQDLFRRYLADPNLELDEKSPDQGLARRITATRPDGAGQLKILGDPGTLIQIDGRLVGALPLPLPLLLSTGSHKVELVRGRSRLEDEVRVPLGRLAELRIDVNRGALLSSVLPGVILVDEYRGLDAAVEQRLSQALERAVDSERLSLISRDFAVQSAGEPAPGPCSDEIRCLLDLAKPSQSDYVLRLRVEKQPADWQLDLQLVDVEVGAVAATDAQHCPGCSVEQAVARLGGLFAPLYKRAIARPHGRLELSSEPPGAQLFIGGQKFGETPLERPMFAGRLTVTLKKPGFLDTVKELDIGDGEPTRVSLSLEPVPPLEPPPAVLTPPPPVLSPAPKRPLWRIVTGSLLVAGGLLNIGIGGAALAVDGKCAEPFSLSTAGDATSCTAQYSGTSVLGAALIPVGGALLIGGTLLIALPPKKKK